MTGLCANCGPVALIFSNGRPKCYIAKQQQRGSRGVKRTYKMSPVQYKAVRSVLTCESCGEQLATAIDHDHESGDVRGHLCFHCNVGLGHFKDRPDLLRKAATYLETYVDYRTK